MDGKDDSMKISELSNIRPYSDDPELEDDDDMILTEHEEGMDHFRDEVPLPSSNVHNRTNENLRYRRFVLCGVVAIVVLLAAIVGSLMNTRDRKRLGEVIAFLEFQGITTAGAFADKNSPQSQAVHWLLYKDSMKIDINDPAFVQRYVISTFSFAVVTESQNFALLQSDMMFLSHRHECEWNAEWKNEEKKTLLDMGIHCDDDQKVTKIIMPTVGLSGALPKELNYLDRLQKLILDVNDIIAPLPYVSSLTSLSLSYNKVDGTLPPYIGLMTGLKEIVLSDNQISGRFPEEIQDLTRLERIIINDNELTGGIHNLLQLSELKEMYGAFNKIKDEFDNDSFGQLSKLEVLDLKNNKLTGPFPDAIWTLPSLKMVDFQFNALDGHLHEIEDEHFPNIEHLDVSSNFLGGDLPITLRKMTSLKFLDISSNRFDKPLVGDYSSLTNLKTLLMTDNSMFGPAPIPTWLQSLSQLEHLSLKLTGRTGKIPEWFFKSLTNLRTLDMDWNRISGTIPSNIGQATNLEHLILNRNWLSGVIPTDVATLTNLKTVMLDNNRLVGNLVTCQAKAAITDCGNPERGCPDCVDVTAEVNCPCCTQCCFDADELCNSADWISEIMESRRTNDPGSVYPSFYHREDFTNGDIFLPIDDR